MHANIVYTKHINYGEHGEFFRHFGLIIIFYLILSLQLQKINGVQIINIAF